MKGTWQRDGIFRFFILIGLAWVSYTTAKAIAILLQIRRDIRKSESDSHYDRYRKSSTSCIVVTKSRQLCVLLVRRVDDSFYCWSGESKAMCVPDMGSRRFCITTIQGVADSPTVCIVDTGVNNSIATLFQFQIKIYSAVQK